MKPVVLTTTVARPRHEVHDFLDDLANHEAYLDHFLVDWRFTTPRTRGVGAGVKLRATAPGRHNEIEIEVAESSPQRIVEHGRGGKGMRRRTRGTYALADAPGGATHITLTLEILEPAGLSDRLGGPVAHAYLRKENACGLERLKALLEAAPAPDPDPIAA